MIYWKTIRKGYAQRHNDVDAIYQKLNDSYDPNHLIILGDFNDIGGSYTVRHLESLGLNDMWWNGGLGYGGTFDIGYSFFPTRSHSIWGWFQC